MTGFAELLGTGNAIVDKLCSVEDEELAEKGLIKGSMMLVDDEEVIELESTVQPDTMQSGGSVANSVVKFAQLGGRGSFIGKVANDAAGVIYADDLSRAGVEFNTPFFEAGTATGRCFVFITPDGQRTMCTYLGASTALTEKDIDAESIAGAKVLLIEGYLWSDPSAKTMIHKMVSIARESETVVAFTMSDAVLVDVFRSYLQPFVEKDVDLLIGNEHEVEQLYSTQSLQDTIDKLKCVVPHLVITRGEKGSVAVTGDGVYEQEALPVAKVVDTTGAGDAYAGGYLYGMIQQLPVKQRMEIASEQAAEVITHFGGRQVSF